MHSPFDQPLVCRRGLSDAYVHSETMSEEMQ